MKKVIISTVALLNLLAVSSCSDFLTIDPVDKQVKESYYTSAESVKANTASLYGLVWWDFTNRFMYQGGDMLAGDLFYTYAEEGQFFLNTVQPENMYSLQGWNGLFRVISYANSIIDDMPDMARDNNISEQVITEALGEAYLFRAVAYYYLTEYWGDVPIVTQPTELITSGKAEDMYLKRNTHSSLYRFICEDIDRALAALPKSADAGRVSYYSALGLKAKVNLTRGCYEDNAEYFETAKKCAAEVITEGPALYADYSTLFDAETDNSSESLIAIQCTTGGYGYGNSRPIEWGRRDAVVGTSCWGSGKGATLSLQEAFEEHPADGRRKWCYMQQGDNYPKLANYTYNNWFSEKEDCSVWLDQPLSTRSCIKKYVINSEGGTMIGTGQDGENNIYLLRTADVYFVYAEACLAGDLDATLSDATALGYINDVLNRGKAGYTVEAGLSYMDLIKERRKEFAFEGANWLDIKRIAYINEQASLDYLNGMYRDKQWNLDYKRISKEVGGAVTDKDKFAYGNQQEYYVRGWISEKVDEGLDESIEQLTDAGPNSAINTSNRDGVITFNSSSLYIALPSEATTNAPILLEEPVDYYQE